MICNCEIYRFSRKYGLRCASNYIICYLPDFWFHTDAIIWTFGNIGHPPPPISTLNRGYTLFPTHMHAVFSLYYHCRYYYYYHRHSIHRKFQKTRRPERYVSSPGNNKTSKTRQIKYGLKYK
jgi:hypothetical protein